MPNSPVLVTGASGFLARHIVLQLLKQGRAVRGSVRNLQRGEQIRQVLESHGADTGKLEFVTLDLMQDDGWAAAMDGVENLIHTASPFVTTIPKDEDELILPAVNGTRRALKAALAAGVKRIVLTSSEVAATRGHEKGNEGPFGENDWTNLNGSDVTPYFKSKTLAEREAWDIMEKAGRRDDLSVVNPGFILGPLLENDAGTSGALIGKMMRGEMPGAPDIYLSCVDVRDAAKLHILAMGDARGFGRRIFGSGECVAFGDVADMLAAQYPDRKLPTRRLPDLLVRLVALFNPDARGSVQVLGRRFSCDHALAETMLGRPLIGTQAALLAMAASLEEQGLV